MNVKAAAGRKRTFTTLFTACTLHNHCTSCVQFAHYIHIAQMNTNDHQCAEMNVKAAAGRKRTLAVYIVHCMYIAQLLLESVSHNIYWSTITLHKRGEFHKVLCPEKCR